MQFAQITGQQTLRNALTETIRSGRIPHAQLFLGANGYGNLALALAYAQYVLCTNKGENDSCGECSACRKTQKMVHPDVHYSYPVVGSKVVSTEYLTQWRTAILENPYLNINQWLQSIGAENKQGNINKDECLQIIKKLSLKTFEGDYKILILWLPEYLAKEGNRLLKLIEEPPEQTLFLLVAEDQEKILQTILSRCQIVKIPRWSDEDIVAGLRQNGMTDETQLLQTARIADGNFNEALSLMEQQENDNAVLLLDWLRKCYKGNGVEQVKWTEGMAKIGRENQKQFLRYGLHFLREFLIMKMTGQTQVRLEEKEQSSAERMLKIMDFHQVEQIVQLFDHCYYAVERNANPKILFLDTSIQINKILRKV